MRYFAKFKKIRDYNYIYEIKESEEILEDYLEIDELTYSVAKEMMDREITPKFKYTPNTILSVETIEETEPFEKFLDEYRHISIFEVTSYLDKITTQTELTYHAYVYISYLQDSSPQVDENNLYDNNHLRFVRSENYMKKFDKIFSEYLQLEDLMEDAETIPQIDSIKDKYFNLIESFGNE